ncbi:MAG: efflux RND transporter periplasmic adaptor subunit [Deltaproteobacteria bacterium]|nr:efflux RND transporter periplasmic adaptor subunit [Deltaproteobacteria bacterium]
MRDLKEIYSLGVRFGHALLLGSGAFLVLGCQGSTPSSPKPPEVGVVQPDTRTVKTYATLTGNLTATQTVTLKARVRGFLRSINFTDGAFVKQGDLLFVIEPETYQAQLSAAEAEVAGAQVTLAHAQRELDRVLELVKKKAVSQSDVDEWQAQRDSAAALVAKAKASADMARINLEYTQVTAPFDGRMDKHLQDVGALVGEGQAIDLAVLTRLDPIWAHANINEKDLIKIKARMRRNHESGYHGKTVPLFLAIEGEEGFPHEGSLDFVATAVNANTGTILVRGIFDNPAVEGRMPMLVPGMYVRMRVAIDEIQDALLVPDEALGMDQGGSFLLVVNEEDTVQRRTVTIGDLQDDGSRVVLKGLTPNDWVVNQGLQRARPGLRVTPIKNTTSSQPPVQPAQSAPDPVKEDSSSSNAS